MSKAERMDLLDGEGDLGHEPARGPFVDVKLLQKVVHVAAWAIVEDEECHVGFLKGVVHSNQVRARRVRHTL